MKRIGAPLWAVVFSSAVVSMGCATAGSGASGTEKAPAPGNARAGEGKRCDYGGSSDFTCTGGLVCCYGPGEDESPYGSCESDCD